MYRFTIRTWAPLLVCLFLVCSVAAQDKSETGGWEKKPIASWDEADVKEILLRSAWSKVVGGRTSLNTQIGTIVQGSHLIFTLRSALLVRYALIREQQLKQNYEAMDAKGKAEFNQRLRPLLECQLCEKHYIVAVRGDSNLLRTAGLVKNRARDIFLSNEKGERRELSNFTPQSMPGDEALFFFPRAGADGSPLLTPKNSTLRFNFRTQPGDDPIINLLNGLEIKVSDIVREGLVVF